MSTVAIAMLAGALLWLRLLQGPLEMSGLGRIATEQMNAESAEYQVSFSSLVLRLGQGDGPSGVQAVNLVVSDSGGEPLISIPRAGVRFNFSDLAHLRIRPVKVQLIAPETRLTRSETGALTLGIGQGAGLALSSSPQDGTADDALKGSLATFLETVGADSILGKLEEISVARAALTYDDRLNGNLWSTRNANVEFWRAPDGVRAHLTVDSIEEGTPGAALRVIAAWQQETGETSIDAAFGGLRMTDLSAQISDLGWLDLIEGTTEGRATLRIGSEGSIQDLSGVVIAENGQLRGYGPETGFDYAEVRYAIDPETERITFENIVLNAPALVAQVTGLASLRREGGAFLGLAGQLDVADLRIDMPDVFSDPLSFDDGQVNFRWSVDKKTIETADTRLSRGDLSFAVDGQVQATPEGWITDFRAAGVNLTVEDLMDHWPIAAARSARDWVAQNITEARIPDVLAQMRFGMGEPYLALDFQFADLTSRYIPGMSPITQARGRGHLSFHQLALGLDSARVTPAGQDALAIDGSSIVISDFWGEVTPADVRLKARGPVSSMLALIDQPPLRLINKLGADLSDVKGTADLTATISFPLVDDLRVADVRPDVKARISQLTMPFEIAEGKTVRVAANRLDLTADQDRMGLKASVQVDGLPAKIAWDERYGGASGARQILVSGVADAKLRAAVGIADLPVEGALPFDLEISQAGDGPQSFALDVDLSPAKVTIAPLNWTKPAKRKGRLRLTGKQGSGVQIDSLNMVAGDFLATGAVALDPGGALKSARIDRLRVPGFADVKGQVTPDANGTTEIRLTSGSLDVSSRIGDSTGAPTKGAPIRLIFDLDRLKVSEKIALSPAKGSLTRDNNGALQGAILGTLGPGATLQIALATPDNAPSTISITSEDAGAVLQAADLYRGARGGRLTLNATIGEEGQPNLAGQVRIDDVVVESKSTFRNVLRDGGLESAQEEVATDGIGFRKIWIPFAYDDGIITLTDALATSPALALKISGEVDEASDKVDLYGVLSPAYVLTGALNEIPVLGDILSGGEGEGILAMTFTLTGATRDPEFSVNPLSVLAPGFLRQIFTGRGGNAPTSAEDFARRVNRVDR